MLAAFWQGLQEGDQISSGRGVGQRTGAAPTKPAPAWPHQPTRDGLSVGSAADPGSKTGAAAGERGLHAESVRDWR